MSKRTCNLLNNLRNPFAEAMAGVEGADVIPGRPCRRPRRFMRFLTHGYAPIAIKDDQCRKDHPQRADTPLPRGTCSKVITTVHATLNDQSYVLALQADEINHDCRRAMQHLFISRARLVQSLVFQSLDPA